MNGVSCATPIAWVNKEFNGIIADFTVKETKSSLMSKILTFVAKWQAKLICFPMLATDARSKKYLGNAGVNSSTPMLKLNRTDVEKLTLFKRENTKREKVILNLKFII